MSNVISPRSTVFFFFFNDTATTEIYTLSLHDALPIFARACRGTDLADRPTHLVRVVACALGSRLGRCEDRKSTRLNSSHVRISYAVFCLKKKRSKHWNRFDNKTELQPTIY